MLRAEKTIVLALLLQLFIAAFSSFLVVGLVSLYDPGQVGGYQVDVAVTGDATVQDDLVRATREVGNFDVARFGSPAAAMTAFDRGQVDAVLDAERRDGRIHVTATAPDSNIRTTIIVVQIRDALRTFERAEREDRAANLDTQPLALPPRATSSPYYGFTYTVLVPLLMFLPVFISGSLAVDSVTEELDRGTLELLRVSPASLREIVDGKFAAAAGLAPAQAALWLVMLHLNGTAISHPLSILVLVSALAVVVVGLGVTLAFLAPDRRAAQFLYSVGVLLVVGGASLLPHNPVNATARLAIDSASLVDGGVVVGTALFAAGVFLAVRWLVGRVDADAL